MGMVPDMGTKDDSSSLRGLQHVACAFASVECIARIVKFWPPVFIREHIDNRTYCPACSTSLDHNMSSPCFVFFSIFVLWFSFVHVCFFQDTSLAPPFLEAQVAMTKKNKSPFSPKNKNNKTETDVSFSGSLLFSYSCKRQ